MSPSQPPPYSVHANGSDLTEIPLSHQAPIQSTQPAASQAMSMRSDSQWLTCIHHLTCSLCTDPQQPHADSEANTIGLRGGDRGGMCPGRFCFCIPCPIPCDFCII